MKAKRQSCLAKALWYRKHFGWSVIPVINKRPCIAWAGYQHRLPTEKEIRRWWSRWPSAGIAIVCGPVSGGLTAFDIDDSEVAEQLIKQEIPTRVERSPSGGLHVFVHTRTSVKTCVLAPGIAEVKGKGSLITVASTPGYKLLRGVRPIAVKDAHRWAVQMLESVGVTVPVASDGAKPYTMLTQEAPLTEGMRNRALTSLAGLLRSKGFSQAIIRSAIGAANQDRCDPPLDEAELEQIAKSVGTYPAQGFDSAALGDVSAAESLWENAKTLVESEGLDVDWLLEAYVGLGLVTLISSLPKVGKTTLLFHLLRALLRNERFLGRAVKAPTKILLLTEEPTNLLRRRLQRLGLGDERLLLIYQYKMHKWRDALVQIKKAIMKEGVNLVVIDTLGAFWEVGDENDAAKVTTEIRLLQNMAREHSVAIVLIHHLRKSGGDEGTAHRGSGQLLGAVDIAIEVYRVQGKEHRRHLKAVSRATETPPDAVVELKEEGNYAYVGTQLQADRDEMCRAVLEVVPGADDEPVTTEEIRDRLPFKPSWTLLKEVLKELTEAGLIERFGKGVRGHPHRYKLVRMSPKAARQHGLPPRKG